MNFKDLTGVKFGRLTVLGRSDNQPKGGYAIWVCKCDCGNISAVRSYFLTSGHTKSCGCLKKEIVKRKDNKVLIQGVFNKNARLYHIWNAMMNRCYSKNNSRYKNYGQIGISVSENWHNPVDFYEWAIGNGYSDGLTIDRKDNSKGYCPENCRWVTNKIQQNNRKNNKILTLNGVSHTQREWEEIQGLTRGVIYNRLKLGWDLSRAIMEGITKSC